MFWVIGWCIEISSLTANYLEAKTILSDDLSATDAKVVSSNKMPWDDAKVVSGITWDTPESRAKTANKSIVNNFFSTLKDDLIFMLSGVLFLLISTQTTGWIARGFLGIPTGKDYKE